VLIVGLLWPLATHAETTPRDLRVVSGPTGLLELRAGEKRIADLELATPVARRGQAALKEVNVDGRRVVEVRIPIQGESAAEAWVASVLAGAAVPIWAGRVGTMDRDGELGRQITLEPNGVFLYETVARIGRCDGEVIRLFLRRYDFAARRWKESLPELPAAASPPIVARRGSAQMPTGRPRVPFPFTVSSAPPAEADRPHEVGHLVAPLALNDGDAQTVWAEGGFGDGRGEILSARSATGGHSIVGLRVLPGDTRSREQFLARARPKALLVVLGSAPDQRFEVVLDDDGPLGPDGQLRPFWIALPRPVLSDCVTVIVRDVTPGADSRERFTSAWGDIDVFTDMDGDKGVERLVSALQGPACEPRVGDVVTVGAGAFPLVAAALGNAPDGALDCVLEALLGLSAAATMTAEQQRPLSEGLLRVLRGATPSQERQIFTLLSRLHEPPTPALELLLRDPDAPVEERARAARALAALDRPAAWQILLGQVGKGPGELRSILRGATGGAPASTAAAAFAAFHETSKAETARRADLLWVLGALATRSGTPPGRVGQLLISLAGSTDEVFEVRARALDLLGSWPEEDVLGPLIQVRSSSPDTALRTVAIRAISERAEAAALPALRAAVNDSDPGVRQIAVTALGSRRDHSATPLLIAGAKQEPWPVVRRAQIAALGRLCGREASDLIVRAIERDVDEVRRAAFRGLVSCKDERAPRLLLSVLAQPREKPALRTQTALLLGEIEEPGSAAGLASALDGLLVQAQSDLALEATASATLRSLAQLGGPLALKAALRVRSDPRPILRRSASEALGKLCDPGQGAEALRAATRDPDATVAAAASAALHRCGSTGGRQSEKIGRPEP
jgi:HEAT repeat protein